ncbi:hypothetical protein [Promicromonospora sukumoe]
MSGTNLPADTRPLKVVRGDGVEETWTLTVVDGDDDCLLGLESVDGSAWEATDITVWHALGALRAQLDPAGVRLCCQGARIDAHVSGMSISMSDGWLAYILRPWRRPRSRDLVNVLEPAPLRKIGTVAEQARYFERWARWSWARII